MLRLALIFQAVIGTALTAIFILFVLTTPALATHALSWVPLAVAFGVVLAIPPSLWLAKQLLPLMDEYGDTRSLIGSVFKAWRGSRRNASTPRAKDRDLKRC